MRTYLETGDVAEQLGVTRNAIIEATKAGRIKPAAMTKRGGRLYTQRDVARLEATRRRRRGSGEP